MCNIFLKYTRILVMMLNQAANHRPGQPIQPTIFPTSYIQPTIYPTHAANHLSESYCQPYRPNSPSQGCSFLIQGLLEHFKKTSFRAPACRPNNTPSRKLTVIAAHLKNVVPVQAEFLQGFRAAPLHFRGPKNRATFAKPKVVRVTC